MREKMKLKDIILEILMGKKFKFVGRASRDVLDHSSHLYHVDENADALRPSLGGILENEVVLVQEPENKSGDISDEIHKQMEDLEINYGLKPLGIVLGANEFERLQLVTFITMGTLQRKYGPFPGELLFYGVPVHFSPTPGISLIVEGNNWYRFAQRGTKK